MNQKRSWEPDRTAWLIKNWATATKEEILAANPGRTMKACEQKVSKLKKAGVPIPHRVVCSDAGRAYERWATVDASDLIQMWPTATDNEILARFSGKTLEQCSEKICELRNSHKARYGLDEKSTSHTIIHSTIAPERRLCPCRVNETRISPRFAATGAGLQTRTPGSSNAGP